MKTRAILVWFLLATLNFLLLCRQAQAQPVSVDSTAWGPMDGFDLAALAKKLQPDLRILMISAFYTEGDTKGLPIEKFLPKPLHIEEVTGYLQGVQ